MTSPLPDSAESPPAALYISRLADSHDAIRRLTRRHILLGYGRLGWALAVIVVGWLAFGRHVFSPVWILLPVLGFAFTARSHARVLASRARSVRLAASFELGLARIEDRWAGLRPRSSRVDAFGSLFAVDLDLFSPGGLFELLCSARTSLGENALARWLLEPAQPEEVEARQAAVADLRDRTLLRENLASCPGPDPVKLDADALVAWGEASGPDLPAFLRWLSPILAVLAVTAGVFWLAGHSALVLLPMLMINGSLTFLLQRRYRPLFVQTQETSRQLTLLAELMARLEAESFIAPNLQIAHGKLLSGSRPASAAIRHLARLSGAIEQRSNYIVKVLDVPLLYSLQLGLMVQGWRRRHGARLRDWLDAVGDLEALLSLSAYHFEHPADAFPEITAGESVFVAEALGHPLLSATACVRNDVALDRDTRLLLVSGSNMSGKSTLLRSVGTAAVMAMAGAPVRARSLRLSALHVAASIQVNDSLQGGRSRFYAEILRLRSVCEIARTHPPVLFLLDELLAGTNSTDRLAGAEGVVRDLLAAGAFGLLSTHDLALTALSDDQHAKVRNAHFEDQITDDQLRFDYKLREGVVMRSNGLALMRLIGLKV